MAGGKVFGNRSVQEKVVRTAAGRGITFGDQDTGDDRQIPEYFGSRPTEFGERGPSCADGIEKAFTGHEVRPSSGVNGEGVCQRCQDF